MNDSAKPDRRTPLQRLLDDFVETIETIGIDPGGYRAYVSRISQETFSEQRLRYWLDAYLEYCYTQASLDARKKWFSDQAGCLMDVFGVTEKFTSDLTKKVHTDLLVSQNALYWVQMHITDELDLPSQHFIDFARGLRDGECSDYHPTVANMLNNGDPHAFLSDDEASDAADHVDPTHLPSLPQEGPSWWPTYCCKGPYTRISPKMIARSEADSTVKKLYFHTTSWAAAESILLGGCMHETGSRTQDFGQAFYLNHSWESAVEWAQKRFEAEQPCKTAILVYAVEESALNSLKHQTYPLFGEDDVRQHVPTYVDWQQNVFLSRKGLNSNFGNYDLVTGPMLQNKADFVQCRNRKPAKPHPLYLQTGLKTFDACMAVSPCLVGIAISDHKPD